MKIVCIGRNYQAHAEELNHQIPPEPLFFMKPDTALLPQRNPFFYPDFSNDIHYETELVLKIGLKGRHIAEKFARKYYDEISVGIDFTARDLQQKCIEEGNPWEIAKAFDFSAPVGNFKKIDALQNANDIRFGLKINGEWKQQGKSSDMIFDFNRIIAHVSKYVTLRPGDLIFTGTPSGVGNIHIDDHLELFLEDEKVCAFNVK
ncbi:MAG: fumarylacetoacetate hydrolase family protein [Lentimicrobiaceae bacterium]|jgi:2-keto-4-pentenoate hydratase/2-oxohepta-3-ene-1,7-dioic acid hydratase in catechol pathway|nr:fumarylacetoacetate hydrolase family protein [Lentimicrobiaceae bacterium]